MVPLALTAFAVVALAALAAPAQGQTGNAALILAGRF